MKNLSQTIRVILFFIFGVALIWIVHETLTDSAFYTQGGHEVVANFSDLKQLKIGSDVRMAGVSIGIVKTAFLKDHKASIIIIVDRKTKIPNDSIAKIATAGLLGNNYVAIEPGNSTEYLPHRNAIIKTIDTPGISDLVSHISTIGTKIENLLDDFHGTNEKGGMLGQLNQVIAENKDKLSNVLTNLETVTAKLASAEGSLGKIIHNDELYHHLFATAGDIREAAKKTSLLMDNVTFLVDDVQVNGSPISALMKDKKMAQEMKTFIANLHQFSEKLNRSNSTLGRLIADDDLYIKAKEIMHKVDNAVNSLENSGPTTAVGIVGSALF